MELSSQQQFVLNRLLPVYYLIEPIQGTQTRAVISTQRRSELETLVKPEDVLPGDQQKRKSRAKRPKLFEPAEADIKQQSPSQNFQTIFKRLKRFSGSQTFFSVIENYKEQSKQKLIDCITQAEIEQRLQNNLYDNSYQFSADVRQYISNCFKLGNHSPETYAIGIEISHLFEQLIAGQDYIVFNEKSQDYKLINQKISELENVYKKMKDQQQQEAKQQIQTETIRPLSLHEKRTLGQNIRKLTPIQLRGVINIVKECTEFNENELVFDIEVLPVKICRALEQYVRQCMLEQKQKRLQASNGSQSPKSSQKLIELDSQLEALASQSKSDRGEDSVLPPLVMGDIGNDIDHNLSIPGDWGDFHQDRLNGNDDYSMNELSILDLDKQQDIFHD